jgi:hypothetical protein
MARLFFEHADVATRDVIKTWSLENLKHLHTSHEIDIIDAILQRSTSLDTLDWRVSFGAFPASSFMRAIEPIALTLRRLRMSWFIVHSVETPKECLTLPLLQEFTFFSNEWIDKPSRVLQLFQCISMPALAKLSLNLDISLCSAEEFLPWLRMLKNPELRNVEVVITEAEEHEWIDASIREIFPEGTRQDALAVAITVKNNYWNEIYYDWDNEETDNSDANNSDADNSDL